MAELKRVAQKIVFVMPFLMQKLGADLRCSEKYLDPSHFRLLSMLADAPCHLSKLAERQAVSAPTMSNMVETLFERGWLERFPAVDDRRKVNIGLTDRGHQVLAQIHELLCNRIEELLASLNDDELEQLENGLEILQRLLLQAGESKPMSCGKKVIS